MTDSSVPLADTLLLKTPPHRVFGGASDEVWYWLNTEGREACPALRDYLPSLPEGKIQTLTAARGAAGLEVGFKLYQLFRDVFLEHGGTFSEDSSILDFGCGWGRIARFFLRDLPGESIFGIDVSQEAVEACRQSNRWSRFQVNPVFPPTEFEESRFDLIYANSVFSHLPEELHHDWLGELRRLLKPGGVFISTTLHREFIIKSAAWYENEEVPNWQRLAGKAFSPTDAWLARFDRGEYCFNLFAENQPHYGFACIPPAYIERQWTRYFDQVHCLPKIDWVGQQVIVTTRE